LAESGAEIFTCAEVATPLLGRRAWHALVAHYERHRRVDGLLPATYDVTLLALAKTH
jgi:hypothetical protein